MLSSQWLQTFSEPGVQAGPLQLVVYGGAGWIAGALGVAAASLLAPVVELGFAALVIHVAGTLARGSARGPVAQLVVGLAAVAVGTTSSVFHVGHPAGGFIPLAWVVAGLLARSGRVLPAGALVGVSSGLERWGLLGVAVLALAPRLRQAIPGAFAAVGVAGALLVPFVAFGNFRMFEYRWIVSEHSLVSILLEPGTTFGWELRLLQGGSAILAGAIVARLLRRHRAAVCLVPIAVVLVRYLPDPLQQSHYLLPVEVLGLLLLASALAWPSARTSRLRRLPQPA